MTDTETPALPAPDPALPADLPPVPLAPPTPGPRRPRRVLRAVARWTCAVLAFAGAAAGTAYYVTEKDRTDVPGLATEHDGRWDYPALELPALPADKPGPFAEDNKSRIHHADLRTLLLPAPKGAKPEKGLPGRAGWLSLTDFSEVYDKSDRGDMASKLREAGVRHIAATGWTMPDGTRTRVYLLRFAAEPAAFDAYESILGPSTLPNTLPAEARSVRGDTTFTDKGAADKVTRTVFTEEAPVGDVHVRHAMLHAGDLVGLIVQDKSGVSEALPFHQTVILQSRLLG